MNLYFISQTVNDGCDTYGSAVVAAETEEDARNTHPGYGTDFRKQDEDPYHFAWSTGSWCDPKYVTVELIGTAVRGTKAGVVCSSFNAS